MSNWVASTVYYREGTNGRTLTYQANTGNTNSALTCTAACGAAGYTYAGTEYSGQCCKSCLLHSMRAI